MARFNRTESASGGMLDTIKSRLGLGGDARDARGGSAGGARRLSRESAALRDNAVFSDEGAGAYGDYDQYGDYDEYGEGFEEEFAEYGPDYDDTAQRNGARASARVQRSSRSDGAFPNLVSIDDVRASARADERSGSLGNADEAAARAGERVYRTPREKAEAREAARAGGVDALFSPTTERAARFDASAPAGAHGRSWDAARAIPSTKATPQVSAGKSSRPLRSVAVLKPERYGDAAGMAKTLQGGDVVVLSLRSTPESLAARVLDFSFGVACALGAKVDCPTERLFVFSCGAPLSEAERSSLRTQGVL